MVIICNKTINTIQAMMTMTVLWDLLYVEQNNIINYQDNMKQQSSYSSVL